jgi:hypothetical protein
MKFFIFQLFSTLLCKEKWTKKTWKQHKTYFCDEKSFLFRFIVARGSWSHEESKFNYIYNDKLHANTLINYKNK